MFPNVNLTLFYLYLFQRTLIYLRMKTNILSYAHDQWVGFETVNLRSISFSLLLSAASSPLLHSYDLKVFFFFFFFKLGTFPDTGSTSNWNTCNHGCAWRCVMHSDNFKSPFPDLQRPQGFIFFATNDLPEECVCRWGVPLLLPSVFTLTVTVCFTNKQKKMDLSFKLILIVEQCVG